MRRIVLFGLCGLVCVAPVLMAAEVSPLEIGSSFIASSGAAEDAPTCTAQAACSNGSSVSCNSASGICTGVDAACPSQQGYVTCNGATTYCPACPPPCSATAGCQNGSSVSCSSSSGTCVAIDAACPTQQGYVTCNGATTYCPACPATTCTASLWCNNNGYISCTGTAPNCRTVAPGSCSYGNGAPGYVECDGRRTNCPAYWSCPLSKPWYCQGYCVDWSGYLCGSNGCCECP